ncbi:pentatricopeptide repeat-containing protein At4g37170 [Nymphaea colorata]|uniref:pentatricopeptide repeat-containing protein At4g37170 n=1 Tax=Nymphaea colorata TaxID=210225 RepID=UPI00129E6F09|nr:pentatricopeptide repeat-containing protein At4g37170 [Nymphaea colorata]
MNPIRLQGSRLRVLKRAASTLGKVHTAGAPFQARDRTPIFFRHDGLVNRLCNENRFKEAIEVLCRERRLREAVSILDRLDASGVRPTAAIYSTLLQASLNQRALKEGRAVHEHMVSSGFQAGLFLCNRMIDLYSKCESLDEARQVFERMPERDACSWNTMISGYVKAGRLNDARRLFDEMPEKDHFSWSTMMSGYVRHEQPLEALTMYGRIQDEEAKSSKFVVSSALTACAMLQSLKHGKEIHGHIVRSGLDSDAVVWSALSDMYAKCGSINEARYLFDRTSERDVVSWTTMIGRYAQGGRGEEALKLFRAMLGCGVAPNDFTFASVLSACAGQVAEELGRQVHGHMTRIGFDPCTFAVSALVDMYAKCGNIERARALFSRIEDPDLISWTATICGCAQNGLAEEALHYFERLMASGTKPDHVVFVGALSACTHAGLVDEGLELFHSMTKTHGIGKTADHYACIVDLLGRVGRFKEAEEIINSMTIKPDKFLWSSLLGACRIHGNLELGKRAAEALFEIEPENAATYVTLANIYAAAGMWNEVLEIRKMMDSRGAVKKPGSSWIEVKRRVHVFLVGDRSHPRTEEIYRELDELSTRMKEEGYVPDTNFVLHDVEEEQKEQNLSYHSEKLAVAFGIIATPPGASIKVIKNLRICGDCHTAIKFISKITERQIVVRDSSRFHQFKNGQCSCRDFW